MTADSTDDERIATPDDFFVRRDSDDNLQATVQELPGIEEQVRVIPMTVGDINQYTEGDEQLDSQNLSSEEIAEIFNNHLADIAEGDYDEVTAEMVEGDMIGFGKEPLLQAILSASGFDMQYAMNMEQMQKIGELDEGKLEKLKTLMD